MLPLAGLAGSDAEQDQHAETLQNKDVPINLVWMLKAETNQ